MTDLFTFQAVAEQRERREKWQKRISTTNKFLAAALVGVTIAAVYFDWKADQLEGSLHVSVSPGSAIADPDTLTLQEMNRINSDHLCGIDSEGQPIDIARGPFAVAASGITFIALSELDAEGHMGYCLYRDADGRVGKAIAVSGPGQEPI